MRFKKLSGVNLPYKKQVLIYATCLNYQEMPEETRKKIRTLCREAGREHEKALFSVLTRQDKSVESIAMEHHTSPAVLYRARRQFYRLWNQP